jgi:hypothetical protein
MCKKVRFWVKKRAFSTILCTILHKNDLFFTDIAPRYRAASPSGKNPPIYTVLNAAFSAPGPPPPVAPWWDTSSRRPPTGSRHPFPIFPLRRKRKTTMMSDRMSPITLFCIHI